MKSRVLVLGAGFGGMELSTLLSEALGEKADATVIDKSDSFVFGYSKIDVIVEFGDGRIGWVDLDFLTGPKPTSIYHEPSVARRADKVQFGASRRARWFGL